MSAPASARPHSAPTTNYTKHDNARLERLCKTSDTATAIELFLLRNTVGWGRHWFVDTISGLSRKLGRSESRVREKLGQMVADGIVLKKSCGKGFYELTLAELDQEKRAKPKTPESRCGKPSFEAVDNSTPEGTGSRVDAGIPASPRRNPGASDAGIPASTDPQVPCNHSETALSKQRQTKENTKENLLLKPSSTPDPTVENSLPTPGNRTVLDTHVCSVSNEARVPFRSRSKRPGEPSLKDLIGEPNHEPNRVRTLRGFPAREDVRFERRMDYEAFEEQWHRHLSYDRDHTALQSYVWHTFTAEEAAYLIHECRRAKNLYGYARSIVMAMEAGLSEPRKAQRQSPKRYAAVFV
jgi:hypothetical protein